MRKSIKSILVLVLVAVISFVSSAASVSARNVKEDRKWASQAYYEYICKNRGKYVEVDLNGDKVDECISLNSRNGNVYVYTCWNRAAKVILKQKGFGDYGYVGYNKKKHLVIFKGDLGRYRNGMYVYKIGKKSSKEISYMFETTYGKKSYCVNGKKVSKKTYKKRIKSYTKGSKSVRKYGHKVPRSEYM